MTAPLLNRPLVLEDPVTASDGAGGLVVTWASLGTLWASIVSGAAAEHGVRGTLRSQASLRITVRSAPVGDTRRPCPDQRFRDGARLYHIEAVSETDPKGHYLTCYAKEETVT